MTNKEVIKIKIEIDDNLIKELEQNYPEKEKIKILFNFDSEVIAFLKKKDIDFELWKII